jgi:threonine synthase
VETAHPVKFYDVVEPLIGEKIPLPSAVVGIMQKNKVATKMDVDYSFLKEFLLKL